MTKNSLIFWLIKNSNFFVVVNNLKEVNRCLIERDHLKTVFNKKCGKDRKLENDKWVPIIKITLSVKQKESLESLIQQFIDISKECKQVAEPVAEEVAEQVDVVEEVKEVEETVKEE